MPTFTCLVVFCVKNEYKVNIYGVLHSIIYIIFVTIFFLIHTFESDKSLSLERGPLH